MTTFMCARREKMKTIKCRSTLATGIVERRLDLAWIIDRLNACGGTSWLPADPRSGTKQASPAPGGTLDNFISGDRLTAINVIRAAIPKRRSPYIYTHWGLFTTVSAVSMTAIVAHMIISRSLPVSR